MFQPLYIWNPRCYLQNAEILTSYIFLSHSFCLQAILLLSLSIFWMPTVFLSEIQQGFYKASIFGFPMFKEREFTILTSLVWLLGPLNKANELVTETQQS